MKIDRMFFEKFEDTVRENETIAAAVEAGQWDHVIDYVNREVFDKPERVLHARQAAQSRRRRPPPDAARDPGEGLRPHPALQVARTSCWKRSSPSSSPTTSPTEAEAIPAIKNYFKAYVTSDQVRAHHRQQALRRPGDQPRLLHSRLQGRPEKYRTLIPEYIKDYVSLNQFAA